MIIALSGLLSACGTACAAEARPELTLHYGKPARNWGTECLPIGNGRLGAMMDGGDVSEHIQFNEESLWIGDENETGAYQAFGDVVVALAHGPATDYRRELDIGRAVHTVTYESGGVRYQREAFASFPAKVMVFRFTADKPGSLTGTVSLTDAHKGTSTAGTDKIGFSGSLEGFRYQGGSARKDGPPYAIALRYEAQVRLLHEGGSVETVDGKLCFNNADSVTLLLDAGTDYVQDRAKGWRGALPGEAIAVRLAGAAKRPYAELLAEHVRDYQNLFQQASLSLGGGPAPDVATDERLENYRKTGVDNGLEELMFQYGRYLLISSSRGGLPANLQGKWNNSNKPPWRCDYHTDVNIQMNYWLADVTGLGECVIPLATWIESIRAVRREATRKEFGVRGWLVRAECGLFGGSTWEWVPGCSAWMLQNVYDHFRFSGDKEYLGRYAYPAMKDLCGYWLDSLKETPDGTLVTPVGLSPEHGPMEEGVSFDMQLVWDLFTSTIEAADVLGTDKEFRELLAGTLEKLAKPRIGKWGQLQEWLVDRDDPRNIHRHTSHLVAVFPGRQITTERTPDLARAAILSLKARSNDHEVEYGGVPATGLPFTVETTIGDSRQSWTWPWRACIWARLKQTEHAHTMLRALAKFNVSGNLFSHCFHANGPFQIDGNLGYPAAVAEMLLQSHTGDIVLLPALPKAWAKTGWFHGLRARGGFVVDCEWTDGRVTDYRIRSEVPRQITVIVNGERKTIESARWK